MNTAQLNKLERCERIAVDIKKSFHYNKHTDKWNWQDSEGFAYGEFNTRMEALYDAVEPYLHGQLAD